MNELRLFPVKSHPMYQGWNDPLLARGLVLLPPIDSIIEDRLVAETSKEEANRELVEQLKTKKRTL